MIMKKENVTLEIDTVHFPKVLLLGNGLLKLGGEGMSWEQLLQKIRTRDVGVQTKEVPYAMQPEVVCGVDVQDIQKRVADTIKTAGNPHPLLETLLKFPFDAVLTTNYTYEAEQILSGGRWSESARNKAFTALDGNAKVGHNSFICNAVKTPEGKTVPVFHIHGEAARKRSMTLSYYSYANALAQMVSYNKKLANSLQELQEEQKKRICGSWLDYFLLGDVWSVGFGLDVSEFDLWWAIERKARENARHGRLHAFFDGEPGTQSPQSLLLEAMEAVATYIPVKDGNYEEHYETIIARIQDEFMKRE